MQIREAKKLFIQRCLAKNLADTTLTAYEVFFRNFEKFLSNAGLLTAELDSLGAEDMRKYLIFCGKTMQGITVLGYWRRLHAFFTFLVGEGVIPANPLERVDKPKVTKKLLASFNSEEVEVMLRAFKTDTFIGRRNYTILSLLLSTGLRRSEFIGLTSLDVDLHNAFIKVRGKGDKERLVPIGKSLMVILKNYLKAREQYMSNRLYCPFFFVTKDGKEMTKSASDTLFRTLRQELKLKGKRFSAHIWRHTFAKAFLLNGGDVFTLQELLGHADVETTKVYIQLTDREKQIQNSKYNPLESNKWRYY